MLHNVSRQENPIHVFHVNRIMYSESIALKRGVYKQKTDSVTAIRTTKVRNVLHRKC